MGGRPRSGAGRGAAWTAGEEALLDLSDEFERQGRFDNGVDAVDGVLLFEHLAQKLGAAGRLHGFDLVRRRRARAYSDTQPARLNLLAWDLGIPEREDVTRVGRAHRYVCLE